MVTKNEKRYLPHLCVAMVTKNEKRYLPTCALLWLRRMRKDTYPNSHFQINIYQLDDTFFLFKIRDKRNHLCVAMVAKNEKITSKKVVDSVCVCVGGGVVVERMDVFSQDKGSVINNWYNIIYVMDIEKILYLAYK